MISRRHVVRFALALGLAALSVTAPSASTQEPDKFYVFGFVNRPGVYHWKTEMTVGDAIDTAGGILPRGSAIEIIRIVNGEKHTTVATFNDLVLANDSIVVK